MNRAPFASVMASSGAKSKAAHFQPDTPHSSCNFIRAVIKSSGLAAFSNPIARAHFNKLPVAGVSFDKKFSEGF